MRSEIKSLRILKVATLAVMLAMLAGCGGKDDGRPQLYPATGKVIVDGAGAKGIRIRLHPVGAQAPAAELSPTAFTDENGDFRIGTFDSNDGAPEGTYKLTLFWPDPPEGESRPVDLFGGKYARPESSTHQVEIKAGENALGNVEVTKSGIPKSPQSKSKSSRPGRASPDGPGAN
jgi:hypothetical protein